MHPEQSLASRVIGCPIRLLLAVATVGVLLNLHTLPSYALSCAPFPIGSPSEEMAEASRVFAGEIVDVHIAGNLFVYEFKVHTVWKGSLLETVFVERIAESGEMSGDGWSCGVGSWDFIKGEEYLVYGNGGFDSRTGFLDVRIKDLAELGEGQTPEPGTSEARPISLVQSERLTWLIIALISVAVAAPIGLVMLFRRHDRRTSARSVAEAELFARIYTRNSGDKNT